LEVIATIGFTTFTDIDGVVNERHRRSLVHTKMPCFKRLGERVIASTFEPQVVGQVVELHVRVAPLNRFTQLGRSTTVPVAAMASLRLR
jgi:hypothetical protein